MLTHLNSLPIIQSPVFNSFDWLAHGFGTKDITIEQYVQAFDLKNIEIPKTHQPHGNAVHLLKRAASNERRATLEGDGFLTDAPGIVCWVRSADCLPILLVDAKHRAVGAVHSGWKGTAQKVLLAAIEAMQKEWKTDPADLRVALGPAIGGHCYRISENVVKVFEAEGLYPGPWIEELDRGQWYLDIGYANIHLLQTMGVMRDQIYFSLACTACDLNKFHSFRKEQGKKGEQVSFIVVR